MTIIPLREPFLHGSLHVYEVSIRPLTDIEKAIAGATVGRTNQIIATVSIATGLAPETVGEMGLEDIAIIATAITGLEHGIAPRFVTED